jgi:drug/metabolite transporter (DMT)-like permease
MLSGFVVYFFATAYWVYLLGKYQYSYIYPLTSMVYLISFIFAIFVFKENVNIYRWIGVVLIIAGVISINHGR